MTRTISAVVLSLIVAVAAAAQTPPAPAAPPPPKTIVNLVRDAIAENDFKKAEKLVLDDMAANGTTPIAIEAFSWLGRGLVAAKRYDEAMTYAARTYEIVEEQLKTRKLDDEARLPIALGAAIEVQALALAGQGKRSEALMLLRREIDQYRGTSIITRLYKNVNTMSLEGQPALAWQSTEWLGPRPPALEELRRQAGDHFPVGALVRRLQEAGANPRSAGEQVQAHRANRDRTDAAIRLRRKARAGGAGRRARLHRARSRPVLPMVEDRSGPGQFIGV